MIGTRRKCDKLFYYLPEQDTFPGPGRPAHDRTRYLAFSEHPPEAHKGEAVFIAAKRADALLL
jgi:hypothetical protein